MISYLEFDELYVEHFLRSENKDFDVFYRFYLAVSDKMGESIMKDLIESEAHKGMVDINRMIRKIKSMIDGDE